MVPEFCLGSTIYPINPAFDWSGDDDVLADAVRETHVAIRVHHYAIVADFPLVCVCSDPKLHRDQLMAGYLDLLGHMSPTRGTVPQVWHRLPIGQVFLRATAVFGTLAVLAEPIL
jgi:hypothetical protein